MIAAAALTAALATAHTAPVGRTVDAAGVTLHVVCAGARGARPT